MNVLRRNLGYRIVSVVIAVLLYFINDRQQNPRVTLEVRVVPEVRGLGKGLAVSDPPREIVFTVNGIASAVEAVRSQGLKAFVVAPADSKGALKLPIQTDLPPSVRNRVTVEGPKMASVRIERRISKSFAIEVPPTQAPPGFDFDSRVEPRRVVVSGLESDISRIRRVIAAVDLAEAPRGSVSSDVDLVAQDAERQVVDGVTISPLQAHVELSAVPSKLKRLLVLSALPTGTAARGYEVYRFEVAPDFVNVSGQIDRVRDLRKIDVPIDISGVNQTISRPGTPRLPNGVQIEGNPEILVTVFVRPIGSTTPAAANGDGGATDPPSSPTGTKPNSKNP